MGRPELKRNQSDSIRPAEFIQDQSALETACAGWRQAKRFAFDTEFIRDDTYDAVLCLIQVADGQKVFLIDPTGEIDLRPFWDLLIDPSVTNIVHAGKEDFEVCLSATGKPPQNIFDVQIAAGFAGYGYPLNLVRLVDNVVGKRIVKGETLTDWLRRPLTEDQIRYAVEDVLYLPDVHAKLARELEVANRTSWAREEFSRFEQAEYYRPPTQNRVFKVKGAKRLEGAGLAALEHLIEWRDRWARKNNRPARSMIRDDVLVELARRRPQTLDDIQVMRGFPRSRNDHVAQEVLDVIHAARAVPKGDWPEPYEAREETPMMKAALDLLSAVARAICFEQGLSHELLGGAQRLRELIDFLQEQREERPALLTGWREEFIGDHLMALLEGKTQLHLSGWPDQPRIEFLARPDENAKG